MNTKIITFCVFATLFMGAYVTLCCCHLHYHACAVLWLSIAFAAAALLWAGVDSLLYFCGIRRIRNKIAELGKNISDVKGNVEELKVTDRPTVDDKIKEHNDQLQTMLVKLTNFGNAMNQLKEELDKIVQEQKKQQEQPQQNN